MSDLSDADKSIIRKCLVAVINGPFFPEWEFSTLIGMERNELAQLAEKWPSVDESREDAKAAIANSVGNLLGYPHGKEALLKEYVGVSREEVGDILDRWLR